MNFTLAQLLKQGGVAVIPTDTIYGIVGSALKRKTVERIYRLRKRNPKKPFIILISSSRELSHFGIRADARVRAFLDKVWPGPVSVILPCPSPKFRYLHRGTKTLAFRVPKPKALRALLAKTGPLVAPSANPEGKLPARTVGEAKRYFGDGVDWYGGKGVKRGAPSLLIEIKR
ncbi:MAG: L-threonylcarbamoyladenylate synthase [Candidatus Jorgensenbacteria bacterium]|nr:L-threonylcarbamoyladenylate synthase [Candidatus Jorgensenbacteria bacterium]